MEIRKSEFPAEQLIRQCRINAFHFAVLMYCRFLDELISKTTVND